MMPQATRPGETLDASGTLAAFVQRHNGKATLYALCFDEQQSMPTLLLCRMELEE